jgi:outer membrane usher protein
MKRSILTLALLALTAHAWAGIPENVEAAFLQVSVNGHATEILGQFWKADTTLAAEPSEWARLGIVLVDTEKTRPSLTAVELGITPKIDETTGSVELDVPAARVPARLLRDYTPEHPTLSPSASGVLINYNLAGTLARDQQAVSAAHELRIGGRWGSVMSTGQLNWAKGAGVQYVRGSTQWQYDDYARLMTWQAGDVSSGGANLGGMRVTHDPAGLDPLTPTYPVPRIGGLAIDPGTLEILRNQTKVSSKTIDAGPYQIEGFPVAAGRNSYDIVLRDKFGREQVVSSQLYFAPSLLRKGLTTWEVAAGKVRAGSSNHYGALGASGAVAHGLTDRWTLEGSAQVAQGAYNATVGARTVLGNAGVLAGRVGTSSGPKGTGHRVELSWDYQGPRFGVQLQHQQSSNYWQLSDADPLNLHATQRTSLSLNYTSPSRMLGAHASAVDMTVDGKRTQFAQLGGLWQHDATSIDASVLYDFRAHAPTFNLALRHTFGAVNAVATVRAAPDVTQTQLGAFAQGKIHDTTVAGSAYLITDDRGNRSIDGRAFVVTNKGSLTAEVRRDNDRTTLNGSFQGAIRIGKGGVQALPYISDSYAVVSIPGVKGVPVMLNGRVVGKTDRAGDLAIGPLASLIPTTIRLDDKALPAAVQLESSEVVAAPRRMAGALVTFPVRTMNARTFNVTLDGKPMTTGAVAKSDKEDTQVGYEGELFLEHAVAGQKVEITHDKGSCSITIPTPLPAFSDVVSLECK